MRFRTRVSLLTLVCAAPVLVVAFAGNGRAADDPPATPQKTPQATPETPVQAVPLKATKGEELSKAEEEKVRGILKDYLQALKAGDYARAGTHIDSVSFLANVDTLARTIASSDDATLYFNYRTERTAAWDNAAMMARHRYRTVYPDSDSVGLAVEL